MRKIIARWSPNKVRTLRSSLTTLPSGVRPRTPSVTPFTISSIIRGITLIIKWPPGYKATSPTEDEVERKEGERPILKE